MLYSRMRQDIAAYVMCCGTTKSLLKDYAMNNFNSKFMFDIHKDIRLINIDYLSMSSCERFASALTNHVACL